MQPHLAAHPHQPITRSAPPLLSQTKKCLQSLSKSIMFVSRINNNYCMSLLYVSRFSDTDLSVMRSDSYGYHFTLVTLCMCEGVVAEWLTPAELFRSLRSGFKPCHCIVSFHKKICSTLNLFTKVYKWQHTAGGDP